MKISTLSKRVLSHTFFLCITCIVLLVGPFKKLNAQCQNSSETFPTQFNTGFASNINNTFTGSSGTWSAVSNQGATLVVLTPYYNPSTSYALKIVNWRTDGVTPDGSHPGFTGTGTCTATSPIVNLANGICCPNSLNFNFTLWTYVCSAGDNSASVYLDFFNGTSWVTVWSKTSAQVYSQWGPGNKTSISVPVSTSFQVNGFKYRFRGVSVNDPNNFYLFIDDIDISSPSICHMGVMGDRVWNDLNNNGMQDAGEVGVAGITVTLYNSSNFVIASVITDAFGNYSFNNLQTDIAGTNYQVRFTLPPGFKFSPQNADASGVSGVNNSDANVTTGRTSNITLTNANPVVMYVDAGISRSLPAVIGDRVWNDLNKNGIQDTGEPGLAGVTVMLYTLGIDGTAGTSDDILYRATISDNNGHYQFNDVAANTYYLKISTPLGYQVSAKDQGSDDNADNDMDPVTLRSANITVISGMNNLSFDAGMNVTSATKATVGDLVWNDLNSNGIQDSGEPGIANVTVQLYNASNVLLATTTSDAFGYYNFTNLSPGNYYLKFILPAGFVFTLPKTGSNDAKDNDVDGSNGTGTTATFSLVTDQIKTTVDAGLKTTAAGTTLIGDFVWYDINKNGLQDAGETGVPGITVILYNSSNTVVQQTTTNSKGFYLFTGLPIGTTYTIGFTNLPAGFSFSLADQGGNDNMDNDVNPYTGRTGNVITTAAAITNVDAGIYQNPNSFAAKSTIGDKVWNDLNNNGLQDAGEPGISGITITLYGSDGVTVIATTITDATGNYVFTNVDAGNYIVGFSGLPAGYVFVSQNAGSDDTKDSDPNTSTGKTQPFTLGAGEINFSIDAGARNTSSLSSLGDKVWDDINGNGIQDAGEPGMPGITVFLFDAGMNQLKSTVSDINGNYSFTDLAAGTYCIGFGNLPSGFFATTKNAAGSASANNSDADAVSLKTDAIILAASSADNNWDLGIRSATAAVIGDRVWNDANGNGIQDAAEVGLSGILVTLYNNSGVAISSTITNSFGNYLFTNVPAGTYAIGFNNLPANSGFTLKDAGGNDNTDSDPDVVTGRTASFIVTGGQYKTDVDAGIVSSFAAVGDYVWRDSNNNGMQDASEKGVPGVTVTLYSPGSDNLPNTADDIALTSSITDGDGYYFFNNVPVSSSGSNFFIKISDLPLQNFFTIKNAPGSTSANNSDINPAGGYSDLFILLSAQLKTDIDAGLLGPENAPLPIQKIDLFATLQSSITHLKWITNNEVNTSYFVVERSVDNQNYFSVKTLPAAGNSGGALNYFTDDDISNLLLHNIIYYRIRVVDADGSSKYSAIAVVRLERKNKISVWPNPFVSNLVVNYTSSGNSKIIVSIMDATEKLIKQQGFTVVNGMNQIILGGFENLPGGIYSIKIAKENNTELFVQKLIK